ALARVATVVVGRHSLPSNKKGAPPRPAARRTRKTRRTRSIALDPSGCQTRRARREAFRLRGSYPPCYHFALFLGPFPIRSPRLLWRDDAPAVPGQDTA